MSNGTVDEVKGRVKEAAGALAGNEELKREGRADQLVGKVKQVADKMVNKAKAIAKRT
jgi:uncharacterized protein YjbJ (UPF0337 family)